MYCTVNNEGVPTENTELPLVKITWAANELNKLGVRAEMWTHVQPISHLLKLFYHF